MTFIAMLPILTVNHFKVVLLIGYLFVVVIIIALSWLYLSRTTRAIKAIGVHAPDYLKIMVRVSIANAIVTAFLIFFFLLTNIY
jgi:hypothetical protein